MTTENNPLQDDLTSSNKLSHLTYIIDEMANAVKMMNDEVIIWGKIEEDWHHFWQTYLHTWTQQDMNDMIEVLYEVNQADDKMFQQKYGHHDAFERVIRILNKPTKKAKRNNLDTANNKTTYWKFVMCMREIFNNIYGLHIPMAKKRYDKPKSALFKTTVFTSNLFQR
tara:strand:- start:95 stop:598 length:504 start_codon:yes stop_codon:yes gene_type:complete